MRSNLDYEIFRKKAESVALNTKVDEFLMAEGISEPVQIPFGYSARNSNLKESVWNNAQQAMRDLMTGSVSQSRPVLKDSPKPLSVDQLRMKFNFEAKHAASLAGEQTFTGKCLKHGLTEFKFYLSGKHHCIECRALMVKRKKEMNLV